MFFSKSRNRKTDEAAFNWRVVANMWKGFEEAFHGFDPVWCGAMSEEEFDALLKDKRIVRNAQKILSVQANGRFLVELARQHGSAAQAFPLATLNDVVGPRCAQRCPHLTPGSPPGAA